MRWMVLTPVPRSHALRGNGSSDALVVSQSVTVSPGWDAERPQTVFPRRAWERESSAPASRLFILPSRGSDERREQPPHRRMLLGHLLGMPLDTDDESAIR